MTCSLSIHVTITDHNQLKTHILDYISQRREHCLVDCMQGFMQDQIIASHTCFREHVDVTVKPVYKVKHLCDDLKWTTNTHVSPFTLTSKA